MNIQKIEFSDLDNIEFGYKIIDSSLYITSKLINNGSDISETRAFITNNDITYQIPIIVRFSEASIVILEKENELSFQVKRPINWEYAKITATNNQTFEEYTISITPNKFESLKLYDAGRYWIEANIKNNEEKFEVYDIYDIKADSKEQKPIVSSTELPERALIILIIIFSIVIIVGLKFRRRNY
tara:strand:- start:53 stop:607 length:555 start_codon:yes stop_codon:yes gene_type:complete